MPVASVKDAGERSTRSQPLASRALPDVLRARGIAADCCIECTTGLPSPGTHARRPAAAPWRLSQHAADVHIPFDGIPLLRRLRHAVKMTSGSSLHRSALLVALLGIVLVITGSSAPDPPTGPVVTAPVQTSAVSAASGQEYAPPWSWPLSPTPVVLRQFDGPEKPWLPGHRGVDLVAGESARISSPAAGRVVFAGWVVDRPVVTVDHGDGVLSSFEPVTTLLERGQVVQEGQQIGALSAAARSSATTSHCPTGCLHWGVRINGEYVDPLTLVMDRRPSILLPLHGP